MEEFKKLLKTADDGSITDIIFGVCFAKPQNCDYAIVLGCDTESSLKRADIAANFYKKGYTKNIIVTGGVYHEYKGEQKRECEIMKEGLISRGIPKEVIIEEPNAADTIGNMIFSLCELTKRRVFEGKIDGITIITEPYHLRRSLLLAKSLFPRFVAVYGYTEGAEDEKAQWLKDELLQKKVRNEIFYMKQFLKDKRFDY